MPKRTPPVSSVLTELNQSSTPTEPTKPIDYKYSLSQLCSNIIEEHKDDFLYDVANTIKGRINDLGESAFSNLNTNTSNEQTIMIVHVLVSVAQKINGLQMAFSHTDKFVEYFVKAFFYFSNSLDTKKLEDAISSLDEKEIEKYSIPDDIPDERCSKVKETYVSKKSCCCICQ